MCVIKKKSHMHLKAFYTKISFALSSIFYELFKSTLIFWICTYCVRKRWPQSHWPFCKTMLSSSPAITGLSFLLPFFQLQFLTATAVCHFFTDVFSTSWHTWSFGPLYFWILLLWACVFSYVFRLLRMSLFCEPPQLHSICVTLVIQRWLC